MHPRRLTSHPNTNWLGRHNQRNAGASAHNADMSCALRTSSVRSAALRLAESRLLARKGEQLRRHERLGSAGADTGIGSTLQRSSAQLEWMRVGNGLSR